MDYNFTNSVNNQGYGGKAKGNYQAYSCARFGNYVPPEQDDERKRPLHETRPHFGSLNYLPNREPEAVRVPSSARFFQNLDECTRESQSAPQKARASSYLNLSGRDVETFPRKKFFNMSNFITDAPLPRTARAAIFTADGEKIELPDDEDYETSNDHGHSKVIATTQHKFLQSAPSTQSLSVPIFDTCRIRKKLSFCRRNLRRSRCSLRSDKFGQESSRSQSTESRTSKSTYAENMNHDSPLSRRKKNRYASVSNLEDNCDADDECLDESPYFPPPRAVVKTPVTAVVNPPVTAVVNPPVTAVVNPPVTAVVNPPATTALVYPPAKTALVNPPVTAVVNPPVTALLNPPVTALVNPPVTALVNPPATALVNTPATAVVNPPATALVNPQVTASENSRWKNLFQNFPNIHKMATYVLLIIIIHWLFMMFFGSWLEKQQEEEVKVEEPLSNTEMYLDVISNWWASS